MGHQRKFFHQETKKASKWSELWPYSTSKPSGESRCNVITCLGKASSFVGVSSTSSLLWLLQEWVLMLLSNTPLQQLKMPFIYANHLEKNIVPLLNQADVWRYSQAPSNTKWETGAKYGPVKNYNHSLFLSDWDLSRPDRQQYWALLNEAKGSGLINNTYRGIIKTYSERNICYCVIKQHSPVSYCNFEPLSSSVLLLLKNHTLGNLSKWKWATASWWLLPTSPWRHAGSAVC